ncbi:tetratricopeptide repeat protein [Pseudoalteromonas sp.]|jgi:cytochrome c-type biogenesis protein CcmH/NrfG|uniref:tetratricopeptide repeat protein n=1 Tax=Pseudoalteromonas sp. TaxID=53249 RepID=UPI002351FB88|nr:tetratricopeptide repeat protein [Pseudoalteromonas sp.]
MGINITNLTFMTTSLQNSNSIEAILNDLLPTFNHMHIDERFTKLNQAIASHPESTELYFLLASHYVETQENDQAISAFERSLELDPNNLIARYQVTFLALMLNHEALFLTHSDILLTIEKTSHFYDFTIGLREFAAGNFKDAITHFEHGLSLNSTNSSLRENIKQLIELAKDEETPLANNIVENVEPDDALNSSNNSILLDIYNKQSH